LSFQIADIIDIDSLYKKDIKVVQFTATPLNVSQFDNHYSSIIVMDPPDSYISIQKLIQQGRVKQYKDLCGKLPYIDYSKVHFKNNKTFVFPPKEVVDNINEIKKFIPKDHRFHIIRTPPAHLHDVVISNFIQIFGNSFAYISEMDLDDFDHTLASRPNKHTFIFIKEKLRCAKTIPKKFIGVLYERTSLTVSDHVIIQGLAGRLTGYHDNHDSVVFTNILSIRRYLSQAQDNFATGNSAYRTFTFKGATPPYDPPSRNLRFNAGQALGPETFPYDNTPDNKNVYSQ
jgi:hypothetical protein